MYSPYNTDWKKIPSLEKLHVERDINDSKIYYEDTKKDYRYRVIFEKESGTSLVYE